MRYHVQAYDKSYEPLMTPQPREGCCWEEAYDFAKDLIKKKAWSHGIEFPWRRVAIEIIRGGCVIECHDVLSDVAYTYHDDLDSKVAEVIRSLGCRDVDTGEVSRCITRLNLTEREDEPYTDLDRAGWEEDIQWIASYVIAKLRF